MAAAARPVQPRPVAGRDYPGTIGEFFDRFQSDEDCWHYLVDLRWPDGFRCPACGSEEAWLTDRRLYVCTSCRRQTSVTVGTIFERTQLPLLDWFRAAWLMTSRKSGVSASTLQSELGLGSYKTAWLVQHRLRKAMVDPARSKLSGEIEVDETYLGGPTEGRRGRSLEGKQVVVIAVEKPSEREGLGRVRMRMIPNAQAYWLEQFVTDVCAPGSTITTDGHAGYHNLAALGYEHIRKSLSAQDDPAHVILPGVHRIASLLKRWLLGTHQGGYAPQHLDAYLDEFTFRFNRRRSRSRGLLFYSLMQLAVRTGHTECEAIIWSRRCEADPDRERGVPRGSHPPAGRRQARPRRSRQH